MISSVFLKRIINLCALATLLTGCMAGPDYRKPKPSLPNSFEHQNASLGQRITLQWWKSFRDPKLNELIELAARNNKNIDSAATKIAETRANTWELILDLLPALTLDAGFTKNKTSEARVPFIDNPSFRKLEYYNAGGDVSWELDLFGRSRRKIKSLRASEQIAKAELKDLLVSITAEIAHNYFDLRSTQRKLRLSKKQLAFQQELLKIKETQFRNGYISQIEFLNSKNETLQKNFEIQALKALEKQFINSINVLCGEQPGALNYKLSTNTPRMNTYRGPVKLGTPKALLKRRPDLRIAERSLARDSEEIGVAIGDIFPKLSFVGNLDYEAVSSKDLGKSDPSYLINPSLNWVALDIGPVLARVKAANVRYEISLKNYSEAINKALQEVDNNLGNFSSEKERYQIYEQIVKNNKKINRLETLRHKTGETALEDALAVKLQTINAKLLKLDTKLALNKNLVTLYKSLGGGWREFSANKS